MEDNLSIKAREAQRHLRNFIMQNGRTPSVRELMKAMNYKSPLSATLLLNELTANKFIEKKIDGSYKLVKDLPEGNTARTVSVPLVGSVTCGIPILAEENIEAMIPVSINLAKSGSKYFLLKAIGDSMDKAGIEDGDLILIRQQPTAQNGDKVVALIDDEATVKVFRQGEDVITLLPHSSNEKHKPIILSREFHIQGVVVATIPKNINNI